jgi:hypothetical protein
MTVRKYILLVLTIAGFSCQKEFSSEGDGLPADAKGTLSNNSGICLPKNISGTYTAGILLNTSNALEAEVNVIETGSYTITTDTVNGYYFSASGNFTATGIQTVQLAGNGTPLIQGTDHFRVKWKISNCTVSIPVNAAAPQAEYSLQGSGGNCIGSSVNGTYIHGTALSASNTIIVNVNVTRAGSYSIVTAAANGMIFSASGNFTATGNQSITFHGSGTPLNAGSTVIIIPGSNENCTVTADVVAQSVIDYFPGTANSNWTYEIDDNAHDTARFFVIPPQMTVAGNSYKIFMVTSGTTIDSSGYYRKNGSEYYRYRDVGDFIGFDSALRREYKFLDDLAPIGTNWKSELYNGMVTIGGLPPQPMTVRFSTTVLSKPASVVITTSTGAVTYNDIIVIEEKYEQLVAGGWIDITAQVGSFKKYYSKNTGLIKYEALNGAGTVTATVELKRYQVF